MVILHIAVNCIFGFAIQKWSFTILCAAACVSVDEDGDRIFISDSNHHRIIISNSNGMILDYVSMACCSLEFQFYLYEQKVCSHAEWWIGIFPFCFADWIFPRLWGWKVWVSQIFAPSFIILSRCWRLSIYCRFRGIVLSRLPFLILLEFFTT